MSVTGCTIRLASGRDLPGRRVSGKARRQGLLPYESPPNWTLILPRCPAVHMIGMKFPLDLVFVRRGKIVSLRPEARPGFRIFAALATTTLEMPAGSIEELGLKKGQAVAVAPL